MLRRLVVTLPALARNPATAQPGLAAGGALDQALASYRATGDAPSQAWVASPCFDPCDEDGAEDAATIALADALDDAVERDLWLMLPGAGTDEQNEASPRLWQEFTHANGQADEALLSLADLLISLGELEYDPGDGAVDRDVVERAYGQFLDRLTQELRRRVAPHRRSLSPDVLTFWESVLEQCRHRIQSN